MHIRSRRYRNGIAWRLPTKKIIHRRPSAEKRCGKKKNPNRYYNLAIFLAENRNPKPTSAKRRRRRRRDPNTGRYRRSTRRAAQTLRKRDLRKRIRELRAEAGTKQHTKDLSNREEQGSSLFDFAPACPQRAAGNVRPKHQRVEQNFTKSSLKTPASRVCYEFNCPIMPWAPPCSCTSRTPKQHLLDRPVPRQIRNMHRKFPVMFEALFRPSVQSMLLCERYCLAIPMMQNIMPRCVPFHETWRPDDHT